MVHIFHLNKATSVLFVVCSAFSFFFFFLAEADYLILTLFPSAKHSYFILINLKAVSYCFNLSQNISIHSILIVEGTVL